jgi:hypothetical protein
MLDSPSLRRALYRKFETLSLAKGISPMGEGVNHIVKREEVQIVQAVQSLRYVQVVLTAKSVPMVPIVSVVPDVMRTRIVPVVPMGFIASQFQSFIG